MDALLDPGDDWLTGTGLADAEAVACADLPTDALQCPLCSAVSDAVDGPCEACGFPLAVDLS